LSCCKKKKKGWGRGKIIIGNSFFWKKGAIRGKFASVLPGRERGKNVPENGKGKLSLLQPKIVGQWNRSWRPATRLEVLKRGRGKQHALRDG